MKTASNKLMSEKDKFATALINFFLILVFTAISIGIVYGEAKILEEYGVFTFSKTANFQVISKNQFRTGEIFPMEIRVDGMHRPVNAIQTDISYDTEALEVVSIDTDNSALTIFVQRDIAPDHGYIRISGGVPSPGIMDQDAIMGKIYFKSKIPGPTEIHFADSSMVLLNDGEGTDILNYLPTISYLILPDKLNFEEKRKQDQFEERLQEKNIAEAKTRIFGDSGEVLGSAKNDEKNASSDNNWFETIMGTIDKFILSEYPF